MKIITKLKVTSLALAFALTGMTAPVLAQVETAELEAALETRIENANGIGYVVGIIDGDERRISLESII